MVNQSQSSTERSVSDELFELALQACWRWRLELCLLAITAGAFALLYFKGKFGPVLSGISVGLTLVVIVAIPTTRRLLGRMLHSARVRRNLDLAFTFVQGRISERKPKILRIEKTISGDIATLRLRPGTSIKDLEDTARIIAVNLEVRDVKVTQDPTRANRVWLSILRRDPFGDQTMSQPLLNKTQTDFWDPIPIGINDQGKTVFVGLPEHSLLIGGEPGGGKSVLLWSLLTAAALDPSIVLWLFDGKMVQLAPWRKCAHSFVGMEIDKAITALEALRAEMELRYQKLLDYEVEKVVKGDGLPLHLVVIDELALYVSHPDKKAAQRFSDLLRDLLARGRAAGVIVVAATQKPSVDVVPSSLRDLFGFRWAMRCTTKDASDTILGSGWATRGYSAAEIDPAKRGVGFLLHEGGIPVLLRTFELKYEDVVAIAKRAFNLRHNNDGPDEGSDQ
ncbi:FtsK/SpoIIIE domain-containing protein [Acidithrix ferrooxidans]|uniref:DNA translocase FtsK n=1 Tax=Acidithrix ferrooxidans TaxID=1280514 RepID=A0A0D8HDN6_9ACTN|nr:FtsK/SpoIIIE domain-containing protein [Acidithrix ferrooxidans]KJF15994.1 DNA translocase FtsK [Acidithrix ferrooxidans]